MKRWASFVQHTVVVCLLTAAYGCAAPGKSVVAVDDSNNPLESPLSPERAAFTEGLARYGMGIGQEWNHESKQALSNFLRAAELDPANEELQFRTALALLGNGQEAEAREVMARLIKHHPHSAPSLLRAGFINRITSQPEMALDYYKRAIKADPQSAAGYEEAVTLLVRLNRKDEAIELLRQSLKTVDEPADLALVLSRLYSVNILALRDPAQAKAQAKEAIRALEPALQKTPLDGALLAHVALLYKLADDYENAIKLVARSIDLPPPDRRWRQSTITAIFKDQVEKATAATERLVEQEPTNSGYLLILGHLEELARNLDAAEDAYRRAAEANPDDMAPIIRLGLALSQRGAYEETEKLYTAALAEHPDDARLLEMLAYLEVTRNRHVEALAYFKKAATILKETGQEPAVPFFPTSYVLTCLRAQHPEEAAQLIKESIDNGSDLLDIFVRSLLREQNQDRIADGIIVLEKVAERDPRNPGVYIYLGLLQNYAKQSEAAIRSFSKAEELARDEETEGEFLTPSFYFWLGAAYEQANQVENAIKQFRNGIALKPAPNQPQEYSAYIDSLNYVAYMQAERGWNLDESLALIEEALEARPDNAAFIDTRGWIYFKLGKYAEARDDIERAANMIPDDPTITDHLGDVYEKLGVIEEATDWWTKSYTLDPSNTNVAEKLTRQHIDLAPLKERAKQPDSTGATEEDDVDILPLLVSPPAMLNEPPSEEDDSAP